MTDCLIVEIEWPSPYDESTGNRCISSVRAELEMQNVFPIVRTRQFGTHLCLRLFEATKRSVDDTLSPSHSLLLERFLSLRFDVIDIECLSTLHSLSSGKNDSMPTVSRLSSPLRLSSRLLFCARDDKRCLLA